MPPFPLSPSEHSYDEGNNELLAVKLTMEEWRQWLEVVQHPFIIWTNHENLAYFQIAECLICCLISWVLLFGRFYFILTYCPGSKNEMLSLTSTCLRRPFTILLPCLPPSCVMALTWEINSVVKEANRLDLNPVMAP